MRNSQAAVVGWVCVLAALPVHADDGWQRGVELELREARLADPSIGRRGTTPELSWELRLLAEGVNGAGTKSAAAAVASAMAQPRLAALAAADLLRVRGGEVQVWGWSSGDVETAEATARAAGADVEHVDTANRLLQAWVPVSSLEGLAGSGVFRQLAAPPYGHRSTGSVNSQGDVLLNAAQYRASAGVNGSGIRVGLTSDSVRGLASAVSSGDLPPNVNVTTCNTDGSDPTATLSGEGTAMLEIVHDLAPGAELWFGYWGFGTPLDFNAAIDCLAANTDVVVDDIAFFNAGSYDGTSAPSLNTSEELSRTSNRIRLYATSVANQALVHYQEPFNDSGVNSTINGTSYRMHRFAATAGTLEGGLPPLLCSGIPCSNSVVAGPGATIRVFLQWSDSFAGSANDYDVFLYDRALATFVASADGSQSGSQTPTESFAYVNPHVEGIFDVVIGRFSGAARTFDLFVLCDLCAPLANGAQLNFSTLGSSVPNQADAGGGVLSVGAINAIDPNSDDLASYSSRGPTNDGRMKPDVTAIDGVAVTGAAGFSNPFFGTSAAAPHLAAMAALLLDKVPNLLAGEPGDNPAADRAALRTALLNGAHDRGAAGPDNLFGVGLADTSAAGALLAGSTNPCVRDADTPCLQSNRFEVKVSWRTTQVPSTTGAGHVMTFGGQRTENNESAFFWFFAPTNFEMGVKVLNACVPFLGNKYWVFISGLTDQGWTVTVRDTTTGAIKVYSNPPGQLSTTFADTLAFNC